MFCLLVVFGDCMNPMKFIFYPCSLFLLYLILIEFFPVLSYAGSHLSVYQWAIYGAVAYFLIRKIPFVSRNEQWLQTFSHELSHAIVGMMFFQKIHSFHVEENQGVVWRSGKPVGSMFISLAPYCLPLFTYVFLLLRIIGDNKMLYVFDLFIGFTLAFHIVCFYKQTRPYQTDIQQQGYVRAFLFIVVVWFFNATIILLSIRKGIVGAVTYLFPRYWDDIVTWWNIIF